MAIEAATIEALRPKIFAMFAKSSRPTFAAVRALDTDYSTDAVRKGAVITTPVDEDGDPDELIDVKPGMVPPDADSPEVKWHNMKLDKFKHVHFELTHEEVYQVLDGIIPSAVRQKANSFGRAINREVCRLFKQIPYYVTSGKPFDGDDLADIQLLDQAAADQEMPMEMRKLILASSSYSAARSNARLRDYDKVGVPPGMNDHAFFASRGYQFFLDQQVEKHTAGTRTGGTFLLDGKITKGDTAVTLDAIAGTIKEGDILRVHGESGAESVIGTVAADVAALGTALTLTHDAVRDVADDTRIEIVGGGRQNILCAPGSLKIAVRTVLSPIPNPNEHVEVDPITGLPVVMSVWQGFKQVHWSFSILFGLAVIQPWRALRLISTN